MKRLKSAYLCACLATSISGFSAIFPDMISVESGTLPSSGQVVQEFQIGKWEVTWGKWKTVRDWANTRGYDIGSVGLGSGDDHPVHTINWYDALKWLNAASEYDGLTPVYKTTGQIYRSGEIAPEIDSAADGYRLPTDAEWQWAARGGKKSKGYTYSGSNNLSEVAWYAENSSGAAEDISDGNGRGTWPTGSKKPNELEIFDMSGNVSEWCWDTADSIRKTRGGNWWASSSDCAVTSSSNSDPSFRHRSTGFRPARKRLPTLDEIQYPVTRDWLEIKVPEALVTVDPEAKRAINVVVINYLSSKDGTYVKQDTFPVRDWADKIVENLKISELNNWYLLNCIKTKYAIEEGSRFRGFVKFNSKPYLSFKVIKYFNFYNIDKLPHPSVDGDEGYKPDYEKIFNIIGLREYVEKYDVKEVWFNQKALALPESNMSSPTGDISNSYRDDDLPVYNKSYYVYQMWGHRNWAFCLHNRSHQYETLLANRDAKFFYVDFGGYEFDPTFDYSDRGYPWADKYKGGRCGNCHNATNSPPNTNYDYNNESYILSNIHNWSPDNIDDLININRNYWRIIYSIPFETNIPFYQVQQWKDEPQKTFGADGIQDQSLDGNWQVLWHQLIPSAKPIIFNKIGGMASQVENWWDIIFDWDDAIKSGKKLYRNGLIQTISAFSPIPNKTAGSAPFSIMAPSSTSGLPVELSVVSGPATITANNTITLTGSGTVVIAANQKGNTTYLSAEEVTTTFQVANIKTSQVIGQFTGIGDKVFGTAPFAVVVPTASSGLSVVLSLKSGPATLSGNMVTLTGVGTVVLAANQAGNESFSAAGEVTTSFNVSTGSQTINAFSTIGAKVYGAAPFMVTAPTSSSGLPVTLSVKSGPAIISANNTVTLTGSGAVVLAANQAGNQNYGAAAEVTTSFNVTNPPITPSDQTIGGFITIGDKLIGSATFEVAVPTATSGLPVVLSVKSGPATLSGNSVTLTGVGMVVLAANQGGSANYNAAPEVTTSFSVSKASQSIGGFIAIGNKVMGSAPFAVTAPTANSGLPVVLSVKSGPATLSGNMVTLTGVGTVVLAANQVGNETFSAAGEVTTSFNVSTSSQTINAFSTIGAQVYGSAPFLVAAPTSSSGLPVTLSVKSGLAIISANNTVTLTGSGTVVLAANQAGNENYSAAAEVTTSFNVTNPSIMPSDQTIGAFGTIGDKVIGSAPFEVAVPTATSGLPVVLSVKSGPATLSGNSVTLTGVGMVVLAANQGGSANYNAAPEVTTSFSVSKASQSIGGFITIGDKVMGSAPFAVTAPTATSGLPVVLSVKSGPATLSGNSVTLTGVGTVVLAANQAGSENYNAAPEVTTSFLVFNPTLLNQTMGAFEAIEDKVYGHPPFAVNVPTASSGLPVVLSVLLGPATVSGNIVTVTGTGMVILAANQEGDSNYNAAPRATTGFYVLDSPASLLDQIIQVFESISAKFYGDSPFPVIIPSASSSLPVVLRVKSGPATVSGNIVTVTGTGMVVLAANQAGNENYNAAVEVTTSFLVMRAPQSIGAFSTISEKVIDDHLFEVSMPLASSSLPVVLSVKSGPASVNGNTVTLTGIGTVLLAANQAGNENYSAANEVTTSFSVSKSSQTIAAFGEISEKVFGAAPFAVIAPTSSSSLPVTLSVKSGPASVNGNTLTLTGVGTVVLAANQAGNENYSAASEVTTSFSVTNPPPPPAPAPAPQAPAASNKGKKPAASKSKAGAAAKKPAASKSKAGAAAKKPAAKKAKKK